MNNLLIGDTMPHDENRQEYSHRHTTKHRRPQRFVECKDAMDDECGRDVHGELIAPLRVVLECCVEHGGAQADGRDAEVGEIAQDGILSVGVGSDAVAGVVDCLVEKGIVSFVIYQCCGFFCGGGLVHVIYKYPRMYSRRI